MTCQSCQRDVATARVSLAQNIGFLVARQTTNFTADLCRDCGMRRVKSMTLITFFFGWWGLISLFLTPIFLIVNVVAWTKLRSLPEGDAPWLPPQPSGLAGSSVDERAPASFGPPSGTLGADAYSAPQPYAAASFGQSSSQGPAAMAKSKAESAGNWALGLSIAGLFLFCIPFVPMGALFMAWRARAAAQDEGREMPKSAWAGGALGALGLVLFSGLVALGVVSEHEKTAKLAALHARADQGRLLASLDAEVACALIEAQLLEGIDNQKTTVKKVSCPAAPDLGSGFAELKNVAVEWENDSRTFTACLRRADRWFVASLAPCAAAPLAAKTPGLNADAQEKAWRESERTALAGEQLALLQKNLGLIRSGLEGELDACSSKTAAGRKIPTHVRAVSGDTYGDVGEDSTLVTVDDEVLDGSAAKKGWEFLNSDTLITALDKKQDAQARGEAAKNLIEARYLMVAKSEITRELPTVPASKPGVAYEGGVFLGMMYLADLKTGEVLCMAPLAFENSESVSVMTYRNAKASDATVRTEVTKDFTKQYVSSVEKGLDNSLHDKPVTASTFGLDDKDEPDDPNDEADAPPAKPKVKAKAPPPPAAAKKKTK